MATAREALGGETVEREVAAGRMMPHDVVVAEALTVASALLDKATAARPQPVFNTVGLSPRELEVLKLLTVVKSNAEIADALFISTGTTRTHVANILAKLDARSRTEAAAIAHRDGLI